MADVYQFIQCVNIKYPQKRKITNILSSLAITMKLMIFILLALTYFFFSAAYEYIVNYERLLLADYDKSLVKDGYFLFRKYNRTNFCLNTSFTLLEDLDGNDLKFTTSAHQFLSNQYKPTWLRLSFNVCEYWRKDLYGTSSYLAKFGNLEGCDIKKGHYYLYNYMPDDKYFPKFIPLGEYMVQMDVVRNSGKPLLKFEWYFTAKFKANRQKSSGKLN